VQRPATFRRSRFDLADIVREHRPELEKRQPLSKLKRRVLSAIAACRTALLGGYRNVCTLACGWEEQAYCSCGNRNCPKCQALAQEHWITAMAKRILPVLHFHLVFTLPSELRALAQMHPVEIYTAFFHVVSEVLLELGKTRLKARPGFTMVLHTWRRDLWFHAHLHVLVTAGGLALDGTRFIHSRKDYLFNDESMGQRLRVKMLDALRKLRAKGAFPELTPGAFWALMAGLAGHEIWIVHAEKPFASAHHVLAYLGRYVHRVGISNSRLVDVTSDHVTFTTKQGRTATLHPVEFLRRFLLHVLPSGFHKIRHAGLYGNAKVMEQARVFLRREGHASGSPFTPVEPRCCPICGGRLERRPMPFLPARSPPGVS
jgi:hypothetical protein